MAVSAASARTRAPFADVLDPLVADGRIVATEDRPATAGITGQLRRPLPDAITQRLSVPDLWLHQVEAIEHLRRGHHVVVATGTGSGKSLCYQLPLAEALLDPIRPSTALVIGPTKALAHDQIRALGAYDFPGVRAAVYDGDASSHERTYARNQANVVFTNPEMLHGGLLPNHARWAPFLMRLRLVVIDEMHVFRGVFGTHLAHVLRRLRRLCEHHGTRPAFVLCSATIGDPATLAQALCGAPVEAVTNDTATKGARTIALLQPPTDPLSGSRFSANSETALLTAALVRADHRVIAFCRGRRATEVVAAEVQRRTPSLAQLVRAYRAGYLADERREIEDALANGDLRAVVHVGARARRRHRLARRVRHQRLPGHHRLDVAADRPGRPQRATIPGRGGGGRRPTRSVARATSAGVVRTPARTGRDQHHEPVHRSPSPRLRRLRTATRSHRRTLVGR